MSGDGHQTPAQIRSKLNHPIVDADGHWLEYGPVFSEQMRKVGGDLAADAFNASQRTTKENLQIPVEERRRRRIGMEGFWSRAARNTRDRATGMFPRFLYERLEELGIDFAVIYPTAGLRIPRIVDDKARRAVCHAFNVVTADYFREFGDRMTPAAAIPCHTPEEAIEELEFCVKQLGTKVGMFTSPVPRPVVSIPNRDGDVGRFAVWYDAIGLADSLYDYDPLWKKCVELKISPTFHTGSSRMALRNSAVNFTFNHIGHFAESGHAAAKGIFLGGVTRRFPELRFAFLEGGVGWGCQLFVDLIEHWEKRNRKALEHTDPRTLDRALLQELAQKYGYEEHIAALKARDGWPDPDAYSQTGGLADLDDFSACQITKKQDWQDLFVTPFYFGCEADDRMNTVAFKGVNPFSARLNAILGSDIGHFDVPDMMEVIPEAYELVDDGLISTDDFRDFTFTNAVRLWGTQNPKFFEGTAVAKAAAAALAEAKK